MTQETPTKSILSELPGGFAVMPNALIGFLSDKACAVFLKIYQCQFMLESVELDGEEWVRLSTPYLATASKRSKNTVVLALNELIGLGVLKYRTENRENKFFSIDWKEIYFMCNTLCRVNNDGWNKLHDLCIGSKSDRIIKTGSEFDRMSNIDQTVIEDIIKSHPTTTRFGQNLTEFDETGSKSDRISQKLGQILNTDIYIKKKDKEKNTEAKLLINIEKNEKEERSKKLFEFFSSRDNSLPEFDKIFLDSFLDKDLKEEDDDVIKSIKYVWGQLDYDEEDFRNNLIDLHTFQNILFHSWEYLKEEYPDYSLTEEEIKNIFGFVLTENEGEPCLYIDPTKIRDLTPPSQPKPKRHSKNFQYSDRLSRSLFVECVDEIGDKDQKLLTSSEYIVMLLIDYGRKHAFGAFSAQITQLAYKVLIEEFSSDSGLSIEEIKNLLKDLPQKNKVTINPQLLIPDKFFECNRKHQEESEVEKMFLKKLEEERRLEEEGNEDC